MMTESGEVVYVGKSKRLRTRLLSYFRSENKGARILQEAAAIEWTYLPSEFAALLEELKLIKRLRPRLNVAMKRDDRHYAFVAITRGPAPRLTVLRSTGGRGEFVVFGPFTGAARLSEALRELSDVLGLRDCSHDRRMQFADQGEMFLLPSRTPGCIRHEIGKCLGPCIAVPTSVEYGARVAQARAFLERAGAGEEGSDEVTERLVRDMRVASEGLAYERAAALRDKLRRLTELRERFSRLRFAVESLTFTYHVPGVDGDDRVYLIRRGVVRECVPAPRDESENGALADLTQRHLFGARPRRTMSLPLHEIDELLVVSAWFRAHPSEMERTRIWS